MNHKTTAHCQFCDMRRSLVTILNPNSIENNNDMFWDVCRECKRYIEDKQREHIEMVIRSLNTSDYRKVFKLEKPVSSMEITGEQNEL